MACSCCAGESLDIFGERFARRAIRRYLRRGLGAEERLMADWAAEAGLDGQTVLEVGGGVGAFQAELLRRGADAGGVAEVVGVYEPFARELSAAAPVGERSSFVLADLSATPPPLRPRTSSRCGGSSAARRRARRCSPPR